MVSANEGETGPSLFLPDVFASGGHQLPRLSRAIRAGPRTSGAAAHFIPATNIERIRMSEENAPSPGCSS
jgi:hypothetical protein